MDSGLFSGIAKLELEGSLSEAVTSVVFDSREVTPGSLFVALRGTDADGHAYIEAAVKRGARVVVCERMPAERMLGVCYVRVADSHAVLGTLAARFYGDPSKQLHLVGVTGTNGKTTIATLLYDLFRKLGFKVGLISTVSYCIDDQKFASTHTTPDSVCLNRMLSEMVAAGCSYCFMEVSSHSIVQRRIAGLYFAGGIFTNLTHDHLDYHGTFDAYLKAKKAFFDALPAGAFALTNEDDRNGRVMVQNTAARVQTYGLRQLSDFRCRVIEEHLDGMQLDLCGHEVWVQLIGRFNASNLVAVYGAAVLLGGASAEVLRELSSLHSVKGRFEYFKGAAGVTAIVDYAHTPDALANVLETINELRKEGEQLYAVVGCGGNRDRTKRPEMAALAVERSDVAILTSDNPRFEDPAAILEEMEAGVRASGRRYLVIADRREAIKTACTLARSGDIILVAGKGHENYQDISGVKHHFDDCEELHKFL